MAYEKPISIKEAIQSIQDQEFVLPSIQREFVWNPYQMEILLDSLMRDYPISTFLFWKVKAENISKFKFYRFLKDYHERDKRHNMRAELSDSKDRIAILDGQQRLTSLYIALKGSDARKLPKFNWKSDHAFPTKKMYLNLLKKAVSEEKEFDFIFLTDSEVQWFHQKRSEDYHWFKVSDVIDYKDLTGVMKYLASNGLMDSSKRSQEQMDFALNTLSRFYKVICENETINFFLEKSDELDKVLQIFIRINSGGTKLSYSDLLLSIATAQWKERDARDVIHSFVERINNEGHGFSFNKDLVLKSCLVLADINDIRFRVDNFTTDNMEKIEKEWDEISSAIGLTIKLLAHFGFSGNTLTATNAIIPIAYFIKKKQIGEELLHHAGQEKNRQLIKEWVIRALLKKVFGGQPDALYPVYRKIINENGVLFPLIQIIEHYKSGNKSLDFHEENIEHLLTTQYGTPFAFMVLSLLYPLNNNYEFHQDHIHPKAFFTHNKLEKLGITTHEEREEYLSRYNSLPNLQLLQETENKEKSARLLNDWININYGSEEKLNSYKHLHYFANLESLEFSNFISFFEARKEIFREKLIGILNVKKTVASIEEVEENEEEILLEA